MKGNLPIIDILRSFTVNAAGQEGLKEISSLFITQSMWKSSLPACLHTVLAYTFQSNKLEEEGNWMFLMDCLREVTTCLAFHATSSPLLLLTVTRTVIEPMQKNTSSSMATLGLSRPL